MVVVIVLKIVSIKTLITFFIVYSPLSIIVVEDRLLDEVTYSLGIFYNCSSLCFFIIEHHGSEGSVFKGALHSFFCQMPT